jgi:hypothetical protein
MLFHPSIQVVKRGVDARAALDESPTALFCGEYLVIEVGAVGGPGFRALCIVFFSCLATFAR